MPWAETLHRLAQLLGRGRVDQGMRGELYTRVVWTFTVSQRNRVGLTHGVCLPLAFPIPLKGPLCSCPLTFFGLWSFAVTVRSSNCAQVERVRQWRWIGCRFSPTLSGHDA